MRPLSTSIAVLVVAFRTPRLTLNAVRSALRLGNVAEVIVVDNASGDDTASQLQALNDTRVRVFEGQTNPGYGTAANRAAAAATSEVLILLNSDAELTSEAAAALATEVQRHDGRCIAGSRQISPDGTVQRSAGVLPGPLDLLVRALALHRIGASVARWPFIGQHVRGTRLFREYESADSAIDVMATTAVSGACCAIGRSAFNELGGFDERFFLYFEDSDLCRRAARAGMAVRYVPEAVILHIGGASSSEDYHFGPHHARSMRQYLEKWYGPSGGAFALLLLWLRAVGMTLGLQRGAGRAWRALRAAW